MKSFIGALAVLVLLLVVACIYADCLNDTVDALNESINELEASIRNEDWNRCAGLTQSLIADWKKAEKWMKMFIDHRQMDVINQTVYEMEGYISCKNHDDSAAKVVMLQNLLEHIPASEAILFENIF